MMNWKNNPICLFLNEDKGISFQSGCVCIIYDDRSLVCIIKGARNMKKSALAGTRRSPLYLPPHPW
jgi:Fe-S-cluster containining protein